MENQFSSQHQEMPGQPGTQLKKLSPKLLFSSGTSTFDVPFFQDQSIDSWDRLMIGDFFPLCHVEILLLEFYSTLEFFWPDN